MSKVFGIDLLQEQIADLAAQQVSLIFSIWEHGDTPIEQLFSLALFSYDLFLFDAGQRGVLFLPEDALAIPRHVDPILVEKQVQLGDWRVDFVIRVKAYYPQERERVLVIECDGHDYHERTKEQAARDRSRDRGALIEGFPVFRFTGSEIWSDPLGCARQVFDWIEKGP